MQYSRYLFFHDSGTTLVSSPERKFELVGKVQLPSPTMVQYLCLHSAVFVQPPSPALQQRVHVLPNCVHLYCIVSLHSTWCVNGGQLALKDGKDVMEKGLPCKQHGGGEPVLPVKGGPCVQGTG